MNDNTKNNLLKVIKVVIYIILSSAISAGVHVISSIIRGEHGAPSFVTTGFSIYCFIVSLIMIAAYWVLGNQIPIKNKVLRGMAFMFLFWISDYMPQILGMFGAHSERLNPHAVSTATIICDTVGYLIKGFLLGALLTFWKCNEKRECPRKRVMLSALTSMVVFPVVMMILELIFGWIDSDFLCMNAFAIAKEERVSFYIVFYLFQAVSGLIFPIIYRYTEFNSSHDKKWLRFASIYGWMLWSPVVLIVYFFGIPLSATIAFTILMLIAIYIDTYIFSRILK